MALKFNWKKNLPTIIWGTILLILAVCLIRVAIWEHNYYRRMEGSPRAVVDNNTNAPSNDNNVNEDDIDELMKQAHKVAPDRPRFLSIEKLGIDRARVLEIGVNNIGQMLTPDSIFDVGWFRGSDKPGLGGTMVMDGHNGGPTKEGVFKHLPELEKGDIIMIERGDGKFFRYEVYDNVTVPLSEANDYMKTIMKTPEKGKESLSLITCTGEWSQWQRTYLSRQFLRAVLVEVSDNFKDTNIVNELKEQREAKEKEEKEKAEREAEERRRAAESSVEVDADS